MVSVGILSALTFLWGAGAISTPVVFERGSALFGRIASSAPVEMVSDSSHYEAIERKGTRYFVLLRWDQQHTWLKVLECASNGAILKTHTVLDDTLKEATSIESLKFLPDGRMLAIIHVSPAVSVAVAMDFADSSFIAMLGAGFTPDPTGQHIAYVVTTSDDDDHQSSTELWLDGHKLADLPASEGATLSWDASGTRVIAALSTPGSAQTKLEFEINPPGVLARR